MNDDDDMLYHHLEYCLLIQTYDSVGRVYAEHSSEQASKSD